MITSALALYAGSAVAAGKPSLNLTTVQEQLTSIRFNTSVNPNEADTTYVVEYGLTPSLGSVTETGHAGSGNTFVKVSVPVTALNPGTGYYVQFSATNKYGTTTSSGWIRQTLSWRGITVSWPSPYSSSGTYKFEFPWVNATMTCDESGYGTIGNEKGKGDAIHSQFSNCLLVGGSGASCKVPPFSMDLNGNFTSGASPAVVTFETPPTCQWFSESTTVTDGGAGFEVAAPGKQAASQSVTTTMTAHFGLHPIYITGTSTWNLAGVNAGKKFFVSE
jgi:hypothetical protein